MAGSRQEALDHTKITIDLLQRLGFHINWKKSVQVPSRRLEYLGVIIDLVDMTFSLPQEKVEKLLSLVQSASRPSLKRSELESLVGFLSFASDFVPLGRLWLKPVQAWVNSHSSPLARQALVPTDDLLRSALRPWAVRSFLETPVPIMKGHPSRVLMTDASLEGWGGVLLPYQVRGTWDSLQQSRSINWLELKAIHLSILHFLPLLEGRWVSLRSDNMSALSCIRKQGSLISPELWSLSRDILELTHRSGIFLVPQHLKGVLNVLADKASRNHPISTEWSLDETSFQLLCNVLGTPHVDLLATAENAKLSQYVSPCPDDQAVAIDAFSCDWNGWDSVYVFPPFQLLPEVVSRLSSFRGSGFVIAPLWPSATWFSPLLARCPHRLCLREGHFLYQETSGGPAVLSGVSVYQLHAWIL